MILKFLAGIVAVLIAFCYGHHLGFISGQTKLIVSAIRHREQKVRNMNDETSLINEQRD